MGIFRRRSQPTDDTHATSPKERTEPDPEFAFFTREQAATFRRLVREAFAGQGLEVTLHVDHVRDADGAQYGLANVAAACHGASEGEREWPQVVQAHVGSIVRSLRQTSPFDTMSTPEVHAATYSRVVPEDSLMPGFVEYHRAVAPGLVEVLNLDLPDTVATYSLPQIAQHGPLEDLFRIGRVNLRQVRPDERQLLEHEGGAITVLMGESMFLASTLLQLDEVVERDTGAALDPEVGVLFVAPFRHQLAFHVPHDASVIPSLNLLALFAASGWQDAVGPLSPDVYWWHHGRVDRVSHHTPDGISIDVDSELQTILEQVSGDR